MLIENFMNRYSPIVPRDDAPNEPGEVVGMISRKHRVAFVVSPHREDQRTGSTTPPVPMSRYWQSMFKAVSIR
jgi:hypothetical protein